MNLASLLLDRVGTDPDRVALRLDDITQTYANLATASARVASVLAANGVGAGDRVAIMLPNVPEFAALYFGVLRAGGVVVPMNPLLKAREIEFYLTDSDAKVLFAWHTATAEAAAATETVPGAIHVAVDGSFLTHLDAFPESNVLVDRNAKDTAVLLYTSGTTGRPKGAQLTHANLLRNVEVTLGDLLRLSSDDVVFGGLPLFHSFGQTVTLNATIAAGASLVLLPRFDPATALQLLSKHRATVFAGVPTMYSAMLASPDAPALPSLRACISGGAALPVEVLHQFEDRFACPVLEGYGLSETSPVASFNRPDRVRKPGSIGTPVTGVEMRLVDSDGAPAQAGEVGEIAIRGHNVMKGYWRNPEGTNSVVSEDGWFRTGDLARVDEDGFFFIVDRKKDLIIRGGFNVYPREIEEVLYEHPAVAEVAVIGLPHPDLGEEVAAAIALRPGVTATETELRDFVKAQVAPYKYPRIVWLVDALPKGPTGKILKREIVLPTHLETVGATR